MQPMLRLLLPLAALVGCAQDTPAPTSLAADRPAAILKNSVGAWSAAFDIEAAWPGAHESFNTRALEGCPFVSRDGLRFFMASTRPGGLGGMDIWMSTRDRVDEPWGAPVNVGAPINSASNDFCPTLARDGHTFYFVSNRLGGCGGADVYIARRRNDESFDAVENVGCDVNSAADEAGPFPIEEPGRGPVLYFSSTRPGGYSPEPAGALVGDSDVYSSEWRGGEFAAAALVPGINSAADDGQPNVRRDALEIFFYSSRPGGTGMADIYSASREHPRATWNTPVNLAAVNSPAADTRPSLSWDGTTLYFGSARAGSEEMSSDIYVARRAHDH